MFLIKMFTNEGTHHEDVDENKHIEVVSDDSMSCVSEENDWVNVQHRCDQTDSKATFADIVKRGPLVFDVKKKKEFDVDAWVRAEQEVLRNQRIERDVIIYQDEVDLSNVEDLPCYCDDIVEFDRMRWLRQHVLSLGRSTKTSGLGLREGNYGSRQRNETFKFHTQDVRVK